MSTALYIVEGAGAPMGGITAFALAELFHSGQLFSKKVRSVESGEYLSDEQLATIVASVQLPPKAQPVAPPLKPLDGNKDPLRFVAPIHASVWAVAAGYLGLFSLVLIFAPFSLWAGVKALRDLKAHPHKTGKGRAIFGVVMGGIFSIILIFVVIGILTSR